MKSLIFTMITLISFGAWADHHEGAAHADGTVYEISAGDSTVIWEGSKKFVESKHTGTVGIKEGHVVYNEGVPVEGKLVIDMTTLKNTDLDSDEYKQKLVGHLESDDFFKVSEFKTAKFHFTEAKKTGDNKYELKGKMTIRGTEQPKNFVVEMMPQADGKLSIAADIKIDRTKFGVEYNNESSQGNFFTRLFKGGKDKVINNEINLNLKLVAAKKEAQ